MSFELLELAFGFAHVNFQERFRDQQHVVRPGWDT
jgi:hypothetical protein